MGAIVYHFKVVFICNLLNGFHVTRISKNMRRKDGTGFFGDCRFYLIGIYV